MNFRQRLARFFWGRYGVDSLYWALFVTYALLAVLLCFRLPLIVSLTLRALETLCLVCMIFRFFSRNHYKRRRENEIFLKCWTPVKNRLILWKNMIRDAKSFTYKTCPHCKATLRLPRKKGEHSVVCPRCKDRFKVKVRF